VTDREIAGLSTQDDLPEGRTLWLDVDEFDEMSWTDSK
jgi:hypothetical protein